MNAKFLSLIAFTCLAASATASAGDLSAKGIRDRIRLTADVYQMDSTGKKVLSGPKTTNSWRPDKETGIIKGDWSSSSDWGAFALRYHFQVEDDGTIKATIEEFGQVSEDQGSPVFKEPLGKKELVIENLEPVVWKIKNTKVQNFVVRFILSLKEVSKPSSVDNLPVAGTGISISDNAGYLWAEDVEFNGRYAGVTSHRGTLVMSYVPFSGAKEMGVAEGNTIKLNVDEKFQISLKSATAFLPAGVVAKVYALYVPDKKSKGFNKLHTFTTSNEERIKDAIQR